jgi:DNA ligase-1
MLLSEVAETSERVGGTRSRLKKISLLAHCLGRLSDAEIEIGVAYLSGELRQGRVGVGPALVYSLPDGNDAEHPTLSLAETDRIFGMIAGAAGPGSPAERSRLFASLLRKTTRNEREFLRRLALSDVRQGALSGLVTEAIANAADVPVDEIRRAVMLSGDLGSVARIALTGNRDGLASLTVRMFRPVMPMLAQTAESVGEAISRLGLAAFEWKLDGARIQVHKSGNEVKVFTRKLNDVTDAVPDIADSVRSIRADKIILDGEALVFKENGRPHPFQVTMRRLGRKQDVSGMSRELPLTPFFFDCLSLGGEGQLHLPGETRFRAMSAVVPGNMIVPRRVTDNVPEAEDFLKSALDAGHEGLMAKSITAVYEAGRRGMAWLKIKPAVTLDLVVLAAEWGHGRRSGKLSNLHLGARDASGGGFVMLGKTFKGMTDRMLDWQTEYLLRLETARDMWTVYVTPALVVEVAFSDIQSSTRYPGGFALRFARVKGYRPDKGPDDADSIDTVRALFERQAAGR